MLSGVTTSKLHVTNAFQRDYKGSQFLPQGYDFNILKIHINKDPLVFIL